MEEYRIKVNDPHGEFPAYQKYLKYVASFLVTMFFVTIFPLFKSLKKSILFFIKMGIVALDIAAFIIFRMWALQQLSDQNSLVKIIVGNIGSTILNAVFILIMTRVSLKLISFHLFIWYFRFMWKLPKNWRIGKILVIINNYVFIIISFKHY